MQAETRRRDMQRRPARQAVHLCPARRSSAPTARTLSRDAALAELTRRYFTSHGPAQLHDFAWWSGLTVADARAGLEMTGRELTSETLDGRTVLVGRKDRAGGREAPGGASARSL